tara:strand:- start:280 stop:459 length:180 start_codon:yes stop_codon:yes gene_type:complete
MLDFRELKRNPYRIKKGQKRTRVKPFSSMTPEGEALYCAKLGLDKKIAKPMKVKRFIYE